MASVLTTASRVLCGTDTGTNHGGIVATTSGAKLTIAGHPVLLKSGIGPALRRPCKTPASSPSKPCTSVSVTRGEARKLTAGGNAVMLDSIAGTTDGAPVGTVPGSAEQNKMTAV